MAERTAVVAIGGNSLIKDRFHQSVRDQYIAAGETCWHIASMIKDGWNVAIGHGNGPQVGFILRRSELAAHEIHEVPLDAIGADTQGAIGYALQQNLYNDFRRLGIDKQAVTVVTQTEVAADDPAFQSPSKPIGSFMDEETARWGPVVKASGRMIRPLAGLAAKSATLRSSSPSVWASMAIGSMSKDGAAASATRTKELAYGAVSGLKRSATRLMAGAIRFNVSSHFPPIENSKLRNPVTFPPGRAMFEIKPRPSGSTMFTNRIGMVFVSSTSAVTAGVVIPRMRSGLSSMSSLANARI